MSFGILAILRNPILVCLRRETHLRNQFSGNADCCGSALGIAIGAN